MFFSEYIRILQNHFKRSIGDNELCSFLFDFVIIPAELSNSKGDYLTVNKTQVSKLMNGISPVPKKIRDHIYDTKVIKELTNNFNQVIVPELNPEIGDLCFQMISIIENDNISPAHKADFEMLATPDTIGAFLAKVFIYVITTNGANGKIANENEGTRFENNSNIEPCLYIVGIKNNRVFNDAAFIEPFANCLTISKEKMLSDITRLYKKASAIKPQKLSPIENFGLGTLSFKPYVYPYDKQQLLLQMADILDVQLPEHFFKFGNLQKDTMYTPSLFSYTTERLDGNAEEIKKVEIMDSLYENIIRFIEIAPYIDSFENPELKN